MNFGHFLAPFIFKSANHARGTLWLSYSPKKRLDAVDLQKASPSQGRKRSVHDQQCPEMTGHRFVALNNTFFSFVCREEGRVRGTS
jgi:hypothetical protein